MKIAKTPLLLSVLAAFLVLIASAAGIFLKSIYARETPHGHFRGLARTSSILSRSWWCSLQPILSTKDHSKRSWYGAGLLLYLLYAYAIYAFDIHFNSLFLVYVAILGLSFYALVSSIIHLHLDDLHPSFAANSKARLVSVFLLILGSVFALLWLREEVSALITGSIPLSIVQSNLPTNPVHVLDLAFFLPAILLTGLLLWQRKTLAYLLAGPLLVFCTLMGTAILAIFLVTSSKGMPTSIGIEAFFALIIAVSLILSVLYIREVK